ncbi:MAG TPA: nitroreductase family protein [Nitrososphaerales archaeon]|nr:nitroreductase family protein [Nitrososphaerales archaeon]
MSDLIETMRQRKSTRVAFDPHHTISEEDIRKIVEAARWAPTPHNMQNFEILLVDDRALIRSLGKITSRVSEEFIRENYEQLSFSRQELSRKKVGILGEYFPATWKNPAKFRTLARESLPMPLSKTVDGSPLLLVVLYDRTKRAPASKGDFLGTLGLGCVMESIWLMATHLGIAVQVMSVFGGGLVEKQVRRVLGVPSHMKVGFAMRLGYPVHTLRGYPRVRRDARALVYRNGYGPDKQGFG